MITKECRLLVRQLVLEEHKPIRHVARILGMARNTVKRCLQADTDQPRRTPAVRPAAFWPSTPTRCETASTRARAAVHH